MASRFRTAMAVIVLALLITGTARADVRRQSACTLFPSSLFTNAPRIGNGSTVGQCYSGRLTCWVGVRGDWLDLTDSVSVASGPRASIRIDEKGVEDSGAIQGDCIPRSNKDREGYVRLILDDIAGSGTMRIRLSRPGGQDTISVDVKDGATFLATKLDGNVADAGVARTFNLRGANLDRLSSSRPVASRGSPARLRSTPPVFPRERGPARPMRSSAGRKPRRACGSRFLKREPSAWRTSSSSKAANRR